MNLTIIPFFLAAQLGLPEVEKWKYGAEINYHVHILSTLLNDGDENRTGMDLNGDMGCRPKDIDTLVCRITSATMRNIGIGEDSSETDDMGGGQVFEIDFDERGVKSLTIQSSIPMEYLQMIRSFTAQMNVGTDIRRHVGLSSSFVRKENFTLGECSTAFNVSWEEQNSVSSEETSDDRDDSDARYDPNEVRLTLIGVPKKSGDVDLVIEKFRNPKRCTHADKYLFWFSRNSGDFDVITSFSRIAVKENEAFESSTVTTVKMKLRKPTTLHEFVKIKLKSIAEATGPLPTISRPAITSLSPGHNLETNFAE
ncbi:hypothetical protein KPH14_009912 [Odynerus spinipes]|uniref:Uncharacterized protein n=1 Tax=Odynerus spinipes TaxID=1348599 RepID=A0AAD9RT91_9HYME|nr:hypothetical protein KPH14_009912 [Odynerus spinipes]